MDFEVEFHPVGDRTKAGDAISIRYGQDGRYDVIVVDGGTSDSGKALVDHIKTHYGASTAIKHVVSTHPDTDHASGLREVLSAFRVENAWLHGIWHHAADMLPYFANKHLTERGLVGAIRSEYPIIDELIGLANAQGTPVHEPFEGTHIGPFTVLSPTRYAYTRLVPQFRKTPEPDVDALRAEGFYLEARSIPGFLAHLLEGEASWVDEHWDVELLREGAVTAAENETSTILYGRFGDQSVLLTADAGVNALTWACDYAQRTGFDITTAGLVQVPHHGSRSNVTPSVLNRILGPKLLAGEADRRIAVVSAPKDDQRHPRKVVMNAFRRRGTPVYPTQGIYIRHHQGSMPFRPNERTVIPFDWFHSVEDYDRPETSF